MFTSSVGAKLPELAGTMICAGRLVLDPGLRRLVGQFIYNGRNEVVMALETLVR